LKVLHDRADTVDADLGILGFAIPNAPVQALDLGRDHRPRFGPRRVVSWQCVPHGNMKPVEHRPRGDAGIGEDAPEAQAAVGEGGQRRVREGQPRSGAGTWPKVTETWTMDWAVQISWLT
jgi:hypothetical protein